jgi:AraC-like DNA-binding protein
VVASIARDSPLRTDQWIPTPSGPVTTRRPPSILPLPLGVHIVEDKLDDAHDWRIAPRSPFRMASGVPLPMDRALQTFIARAQVLMGDASLGGRSPSDMLRDLGAALSEIHSACPATRCVVASIVTRILAEVETHASRKRADPFLRAVTAINDAAGIDEVRAAVSSCVELDQDVGKLHQEVGVGTVAWRAEIALALIAERACCPTISADSVAEASGISRCHLQRLLRSQTGLSFRGHVIRARMPTVTRLLGSSSWSIKEIAVRCGYSSTRAFDRQFKHVFGMTPSEWRFRNASSQPPRSGAKELLRSGG